MTSPVPDRIGKYQVTGHVADEPLAEVLQAHLDGIAGFRRGYAIKWVHPALAAHTEAMDLVQAHVRQAAGVLHSNVVQLLDYGREGDRPFVVVEWIDGWTLADVLGDAAAHRVPVAQACWIGVQLLQALEYAHARHAEEPVVHGALRARHVLLGRVGDVKLADLGLARAADEIAAAYPDLGLPTETPPAPELLDGGVPSPASDLFAVAVLLRQALTGVHPYLTGNAEDERTALAAGDVPSIGTLIDDLPSGLVRVLDMALSSEPSARPADATTFKTALQDVMHDLGDIFTPERCSRWLHDRFGESPERARLAPGRVSQELDEDDLLAEPDDEPELELHDLPERPDDTAESRGAAAEGDALDMDSGPPTHADEDGDEDDGRTAVRVEQDTEGTGAWTVAGVGAVDAAVATKLAVLKARGAADTVAADDDDTLGTLVADQVRKTRFGAFAVTGLALLVGIALGAALSTVAGPLPYATPAPRIDVRAPTGLEVLVDGKAAAPDRDLTPGVHRLEVRGADIEPWEVEVTLVPGEYRVLQLESHAMTPSTLPDASEADADATDR